jgi:hypothetical protein
LRDNVDSFALMYRLRTRFGCNACCRKDGGGEGGGGRRDVETWNWQARARRESCGCGGD